MEKNLVIDSQGRTFKSLRMSITSACDLACTYCVPSSKREPCHMGELTADQFFDSAKLLYETIGIEKVRLTGGEPLLSKKLITLLPKLNQLPFKEISLTTNGQKLAEYAEFLKNNGIQRINVSLDTLDDIKFREITRGGVIQNTLKGIEKALQTGLKIKIKTIPIRGFNDDEIVTILDFCLTRGIELRYIELMKMGHLSQEIEFKKQFIPMDELLEKIGEKYEITRKPLELGSTAERFIVNGNGSFGIIANGSSPFCTHCNRLRLSANGFIHGCISSTEKFSMADLLDLPEEEAKEKLIVLLNQALSSKQAYSFYGSELNMKSLGG